MFSFTQLAIPLVQAPMAGGVNTPAMVAGVINAGGVGSYGFAYEKPEKIAVDLANAQKNIKAQSKGALNANFFVFKEVERPDDSAVEAAVESLVSATAGSEIELRMPSPPFFPSLEKQLEPVWDARPEIITFHFGLPDLRIIEQAHSLNIAVGVTATCAEEARKIEAAGADFIVAQGIEAGGHRGIFDLAQADEKLGVHALVVELSTRGKLPLVAAGGLVHAEDIKQVLDAGASAVQLGTAFLTTKESGASPAHKRYLLQPDGRKTELTRGFSGRPARAISNRFVAAMIDKPTLPFPLQNTITGPLRAAAGKRDDGEYQSLWSGTGFSACRDETIVSLISRLF